jgi:hypothetical protein
VKSKRNQRRVEFLKITAQSERIHNSRFANQNTPLDLMRLAKETLPNATPLTPEERVSINEFFGPTSNEPGRCEQKGSAVGLDGMIETIYHLSIIGRQAWHGL